MLSRTEILQAIRKKEIRVTPFRKENVGPCSIDLTLGNEFKVFEPKSLRVEEKAEYKGKRVVLKKGECMELPPHEFVLGITKETLKLSHSLAGRITGRSRFARMGLMVHVSSSLIQPGVDNVQVLEIVNVSPGTLYVIPGVRVCQVTFHRLGIPAEYRGRYRFQRAP
ncbi:dCTP deaminase [Candidatus Micrarchaeota archaeon]|nr:dCTP deaminase [Candidatus Micrarchaeota archaeon]